MTNFEKIKTMTIEELTQFLVQSTAYKESVWSQTSYLNFKNKHNANYEDAIDGTIDWLAAEVN